MKKKPVSKKTKKTTHTIRFFQGAWSSRWNWNVTATNGEVIAFSNQGHENRGDARTSVLNFLKAAKCGTVSVPK